MKEERENLLTPEEVAAWLKIKTSWLYQHIHARSLPFRYVKVGRYCRFPESGIREYLRQQEVAQ
ncbi:MAG: helix-turn-helix domain-containing protein [Acidobacteriota bacterium]|nr:helix-turn-helix domain-containing protein [Acidobacteriota bacterium]